MLKHLLIVSILILTFFTFVAYKLTRLDDRSSTPPISKTTAGESATATIATHLDTPWEIAFLPNGDMLVTERPGILRVIGENPIEITVPDVTERGEGGLLGLAIHPDYKNNEFIYLYLTTGTTTNRVMRYTFDGTTIRNGTIIIDDLPASSVHNGGRIAFGPDGHLYVTSGDARDEMAAQDTTSLAGKILRIKDDGTIPADNPFGNAVYSYGHRNPQGLAWDNGGGLWSTEHGRSGARSGYDEINYIEKGGNYGWPTIQGDGTSENMIAPVIQSGPTTTWAPADILYYDGSLYFVGLRGAALYKVPITSRGTLGSITEHFENEFGRLRAIAIDMNNDLFIGTSNHDGRGDPKDEDDRIVRMRIE